MANKNKRFPSAEIKTADEIISCFQHLPGFASWRTRGSGACRVDGLNVSTLHSGIPGVSRHRIAECARGCVSLFVGALHPRRYRTVPALQSEVE